MIRHFRAILAIALALATPLMAADDTNALRKLLPADAKLDKLAGGMQFIEGPVWSDAEGGYLVFSDIPANKIMKWDGKTMSVFREDSHGTNGNTRDPQGRLISCEHTSRRVRLERQDGTEYVDNCEGKKFNSPNDVVVKSDGSIYFTDPPYGLPKGARKEQDGNHVFRYNPADNSIAVLARDFDMPNGLCFSPDEKKLYIADSGKPHHIRAFDVKDNGTLAGGEVFCVIDKGAPDGIRCDEHGNVWSSAGNGAHIFSPDGKLIGKLPVPETPANLCFGGADGKTLFITARTSLYSVKTNVRGAARPTTRP
jgi:gluconolactonase